MSYALIMERIPLKSVGILEVDLWPIVKCAV